MDACVYRGRTGRHAARGWATRKEQTVPSSVTETDLSRGCGNAGDLQAGQACGDRATWGSSQWNLVLVPNNRRSVLYIAHHVVSF